MKKLMLLVAFFGLLSACTVVGPSERAVRYNFGKVSDEILQSGTHLWIPYVMGSETFEVRIMKLEANVSSGTKDQQEVSTTVSVNIQVDATKIVDIVKTVGNEKSLFDRIKPLIQESINANISKYSAEEVLTKRGQLKKDIEEMVKERVSKYGVILHDISIQDLQYSKEYADSIEQKQIAEQKAKQSEYETQRIEQEAKAAVAKAKGEAESNRMKMLSLTPQLIQYEAVQKWDGKLPMYNGGSGPLPFINLNK